MPVVSFGDIDVEAVANDQRFGVGATAPIWGAMRAGVFGVSDYRFNVGLSAGVSFRI